MAKLKASRGVDVDALEADAERAAYRQRIDEDLIEKRAARRANLGRRRAAVEGATGLYVDLAVPQHVRLDLRGVRAQRVRTLPPSLGGPDYPTGLSREVLNARRRATTPSLVLLAQRRGFSLSTYLSMICVQQAENTTHNMHPTVIERKYGPATWAQLCARAAPGDTRASRRQRMRRDLDPLVDVGLVELATRGSGLTIEKFRYRADRAHPPDTPFTNSPGEHLRLPVTFFLNGWHLVLTQAEISALLVLRDAVDFCEDPEHWGVYGLTLTQHMRHAWYGISSEAWESLHELREFGLVEHFDAMPHRRRGKIQKPSTEQEQEAKKFSLAPEPYEWWPLGDEVFDRWALKVVSERLRESELPPRVTDDEHSLTREGLTPHPANPTRRLLDARAEPEF